MRTISAEALARSGSGVQRIAWLLELQTTDLTWRGATRAVTLDGDLWPARLAEVERWREALPASDVPGGRVRGEADVRVADLPSDSDSLQSLLAVTPPLGVAATLRLAWLDETTTHLDDAAAVLRGRLTQWRVVPTGVRLRLEDDLSAAPGRRVGRLLRPEMLPRDDSPSFGLTLPWIVGRIEDAALLPLCAGVAGRLTRAVQAEDLVLPLVSLDGFPPQGIVQVGAEMIAYTALDAANSTLGTAGEGVTRGAAPAAQPAGVAVRLVPEGGFRWLVADHPCRLIESLRADGVTLDAAAWLAETLPLGEFSAQIVTLAQWPLNSNGKEAVRLTATVQGWPDEAGNLMENPAAVVRWLLTDARLTGLDAARLDAAAWDAMRGDMAARGLRFARQFSGDELLGDLIDSAAREAGLWVGAGDPIRPIEVDATPRPERAEMDLDATRALTALAPAQVSAPQGGLPSDAVELVGPPLSQGRGRPTYQFPPESVASGRIPRHFPAEWLDLMGGGAAGELGERIWTHLAEAPFEHAQDYPPGAALLEAGATACLTAAALDLSEALAFVQSVEAGPGARVRLGLSGPWAGVYYWRADRFNYIRRYAFGGQVVFMHGGRPVARLTRQGTLRLAGRLSERAVLTAGPFDGPVALGGDWLYLCVGSGAAWTPFLRIDTLGNADLAGTLRERSTQAIDPGGLGLGADAAGFRLSSDGLVGALEWIAATQTLHLPGILIERVRL